ncbi:uncharacterized protein LACBIDRAFT_333192 [Laccaria bicolor S238N-H82]|uniref:Predicted protein n=1 Tax=Laccaria bicolor (strain S238N-H82 / ATCC MYA-4686) TaxID=486041 RepID=B0DV69_LACBS|nr:uncharacterized protein LACBIDRAFT_333192 [Laccaria bicolor S238N-H82]EDR01526.1 predicted protein [Laccaria bicolor S238N-H82]|eukprot:XP_001887878.1 predicted protein [Laccaria bicolor S238N-H82]
MLALAPCFFQLLLGYSENARSDTPSHMEEEVASPKGSLAATFESSVQSPNSTDLTHREPLPMSMDAQSSVAISLGDIPSIPTHTEGDILSPAGSMVAIHSPMSMDAKSPVVVPSLPSAPLNPSCNATSDKSLIPQPHAAHTFPQTQTLTTSDAKGHDIDVNMHPVETGLPMSVDLKQSFNELVESAERNLTSQPGRVFQRHQSVLHGYESTLATHKANLEHYEVYFTGVAKGEGVPQHYEQWFVNKFLEITADANNTARTAIEKGEKLLHGYKARMDAGLCSLTLVEVLHICRNHMMVRGSEMSDVAKWKTLLHYTEDELIKTDAEAVTTFQSSRKWQDDEDFEDGEDVKPKIEVGFSDKKTPAPEKFREDWLDMNETQQEEMQVACKKAINLFLLKGEQIDSTMRRMIPSTFLSVTSLFVVTMGGIG